MFVFPSTASIQFGLSLSLCSLCFLCTFPPSLLTLFRYRSLPHTLQSTSELTTTTTATGAKMVVLRSIYQQASFFIVYIIIFCIDRVSLFFGAAVVVVVIRIINFSYAFFCKQNGTQAFIESTKLDACLNVYFFLFIFIFALLLSTNKFISLSQSASHFRNFLEFKMKFPFHRQIDFY